MRMALRRSKRRNDVNLRALRHLSSLSRLPQTKVPATAGCLRHRLLRCFSRCHCCVGHDRASSVAIAAPSWLGPGSHPAQPVFGRQAGRHRRRVGQGGCRPYLVRSRRGCARLARRAAAPSVAQTEDRLQSRPSVADGMLRPVPSCAGGVRRTRSAGVGSERAVRWLEWWPERWPQLTWRAAGGKSWPTCGRARRHSAR